MPKRKHLTLKQKCDLINEYTAGKSVTALSIKYEIAKSTVCSITKNRQNILKNASQILVPGKKKTLRKGEMPRMEKMLYKWFIKQRSRNVPVGSNMIKVKAKEIHQRIKENDGHFYASDGWLQNFKNRVGIRYLKICGEKLSSQPALVQPFKDLLAAKIAELQLTKRQIYNADESGLFYKLLPDKTYVAISEKSAPGMKIAKQRVTFLACTNASGNHKLKPLLIGKARNPRCFRNFNLPVLYDNSKNAWMTCGIFRNWFHKNFVPEVKSFLGSEGLPIRAILLLDNAPCHPAAGELKSEDGLILVMYMPPNVTPLIQPMDQNVIRITKLYYRSSLLTTIISNKEGICEAVKKITLKDAAINLYAAWSRLDAITISKCWTNILSEEEPDEDDIPLSIWRTRLHQNAASYTEEVAQLLRAIDPNITTSDINNWNKDNFADEIESEKNSDSESDNETEVPEEKITARAGFEALNMSLKWSEQNNISLDEILILKKIKEKALLKVLDSKQRQMKVTDFFCST